MPLRSHRLAVVLVVALLSMLVPPAPAGAAPVDRRIERWALGAEAPAEVLAAVSEHSEKLPIEFAERLEHSLADGTLQVMVALATRDASIEAAMQRSTTWLEWYGDGPRFLGRVTPDQFGDLLGHPSVMFAEPDYKINHFMSTSTVDVHARSLGADGTGVWSFDPTTGDLGSLVSDVPGLSVDDATGKDVVVQITDSGIDRTHKDFGGWDCVPQPYLPCESRIVRSVSVDQLIGAGVDGGDSAPTTEAASGHGTHVAGTVAGNGFYSRDGEADTAIYGADGYTFGVAPQAGLISVKNGDSQWAGLSSFALQWTLDHAAEYGIRVSSNSWGCLGGCSFNGNSVDGQLFRDLHNAGVVVTFAVGNDGGGTNGAAFSGYAQSPYVLGVASYDDTNHQLASSSSRGVGTTGLADPATWTPESEPINGVRRPDVAAPGVAIWSARTLTGGTSSGVPRVNGSDVIGGGTNGVRPYVQMGGTSMATPHVAGAAALLFGACDDATSLDVMRAIMVGADPADVRVGSRQALAYEAGYGALEIRRSLDWLRDQPICGGTGGGDPTPTPTPTDQPSPTPTETQPSGEETTTRYYFHSATGFNNADIFLEGGTSFDTSEPTFTSDAYALDFPFATKGGPAALYDPSWTGNLEGGIKELTVDFWQQSPRGVAADLAFDVTLWVGGTATTIGSFTAEASDPSAPARVTHTFTDLDLPVTGPVTIDINDSIDDLEEGTAIVYDSVDHPSGFTITTGGAGGTPSPSPTESTTPTPDPTQSPPPTGSRGTYTATPNDPYFPDSEDLFAPQQWGPQIIQAPQAWTKPRATGFGINVAVLDSGVDLEHEDLQCPGKLAVVPGSDVMEDGNGPDDVNGHGSHVAGIIGACTNNGTGVAGVAPDSTIMPFQIFGADGSGSIEAIEQGIRRATDAGAHVINMSLSLGVGALPAGGGFLGWVPGIAPEIDEAIDYANSKGVVLVAAAGNDSLPLCEYPAFYTDVVCVGATDNRDLKSWYSGFPNKADLGPAVTAPGGSEPVFCDVPSESVYSLWPEELNACALGDELSYRAINGTSMATPHVAGVAALVYDRLGGERSAENRAAAIEALTTTAADLGAPGYDPVYGYGRIDALAAVDSITVVEPTPSAATTVSFTDGSAESGQYSDKARIEARLVETGTGAPLAGETLAFTLTGEAEEVSWEATTDDEGVAAQAIDLVGTPGSYVLTVAFAGREGVYLASGEVDGFVIERDDSDVVVDVTGKGVRRTVSARLTDADAGSGLEGRTILFYADGHEIGSAVTDADGVATLNPIPDDYRGAKFEFEGVFEGDELYGESRGAHHT